MYLDHFGLSEPPFRITPHTDFFFSGANRGATLDALIYAITHDEGIVKVGGEVGSGKTMLCRVLMERLPEHVETIYLANPSLSRDEILSAIADELQMEVGSKRASRLLRELQEHLIKLYAESRHVVVLIDEAHAMPADTLEEIRLLSNLETDRHKLLQIVLFGQPELDEHLNTSEMRQLKDRITHSFRLEPLLRRDVEGYIDFRMRAAGYRGPNVFSPQALRRIASASDGLTRRINILADKALLAAFADNAHAVTEKEVRRAIRDSEFYRPRAKPSRLWLTLGGVAVGLALGVAAYYPFRTAERPLEARVSRSQEGPAAAGKSVQSQAAAVPAVADQGSALPAKPESNATSALTLPARANEALSAPVSSSQGPVAPAAIRADAKKGRPSENASAVAAPATATRAKDLSTGNGQGHAGSTSGAPNRGGMVRERFAATQSWLEGAPAGHYAIQLITVSEKELPRLENFLLYAAKAIPKEEIYVYSVKIDGGQYYRAAYGSFPGASDATAALKELPEPLKANAPYLRSIERMRSQNRR